MTAEIYNLEDYRKAIEEENGIEVDEGSELDIALTFTQDAMQMVFDSIINILVDEKILPESYIGEE